MKRIDFITAGIVSAVWGVLTCAYCVLGGTINGTNEIDFLGHNMLIPSHYWDWLFVGISYIMVASRFRGHWVPTRRDDNDWETNEWLLWMITAIIFMFVSAWACKTFRGSEVFNNHDYVIVVTISLMFSYGTKARDFVRAITIFELDIASKYGWYVTLLSLSFVFAGKILTWLVVNTFRSGFRTALSQLWESLVLGRSREVGEAIVNDRSLRDSGEISGSEISFSA